jgi:hypothetical protein
VDGDPERREAYWQGRLIDAPWKKKSRAWRLLCEMTERAAAGRPGVTTDGESGTSPRYARGDLRKLLPESLYAYTTGGPEFRLTLPSDRLALIRVELEERLEPN